MEEDIPAISEQAVRKIVQDEMQKALAAFNIRTQADRTIFQKGIQILDAKNIQLGRTNGTMIGTANDQKLGFFGATPVLRQASITTPTGGGTAGVDTPARTAINQIITDLKNLGLTN